MKKEFFELWDTPEEDKAWAYLSKYVKKNEKVREKVRHTYIEYRSDGIDGYLVKCDFADCSSEASTIVGTAMICRRCAEMVKSKQKELCLGCNGTKERKYWCSGEYHQCDICGDAP